MESNPKKIQNTLTREGKRETKRPDEMRGKTKRPDEGEGKEGTDFKNPPPSLSVVWRAWYLWTPHISNFQYPKNLGCKKWTNDTHNGPRRQQQTRPKKNKPHANWARQKRNSGKGKENALPRRMPARACGVAAAVGSFVGRRSSERWPEWNPPLSSREAFVPTTCQLAMEVESGLQKKTKSSDFVLIICRDRHINSWVFLPLNFSCALGSLIDQPIQPWPGV